MRHFPLQFQLLNPLLEVAVEVNDALLNRPVKALEPIGSAGNLCLQGCPAPLYGLILGALTLN